MVELLRHFLGLCPDHATHLNIFDAIVTTGALAFAGPYVTRIKSIFWRKSSRPQSTAADEPTQECGCGHTHDEAH